MRVLFIAAEAAPLVKVGGLGDVAGSLPLALKRLEVDIRLAVPWYTEIDVGRFKVCEENGAGVTTLGKSDVPVYLLAREVFLKTGSHKAIAGTKAEEAWFSGFCEAVVRFLKDSEWKPEILHGNDWHVAKALSFLEKTAPETLAEWGYLEKNLATLLTIHNLSYHPTRLREAILATDIINAVSPTYAREILTPEFCEDLCEELNARKEDVYGVLNGIDYAVWNPETDGYLSECYSTLTWKGGKARNKRELRSRLGLEESTGMLLGFVGRIDANQKGIGVLIQAVERLVALGCQLVVLGTGDPRYERKLNSVAVRYPGKVAMCLRFDEQLAHMIYAGADALVIPSRFEPCGLIQLIAMKYGTLPIAHDVGGLVDTIRDGETGFLFKAYSSVGLVSAVERAKAMYSTEPVGWEMMVTRAMRENFSWERSAGEYIKLYEKAREKSKE